MGTTRTQVSAAAWFDRDHFRFSANWFEVTVIFSDEIRHQLTFRGSFQAENSEILEVIIYHEFRLQKSNQKFG